ncbi:hypothetical protein J6590_051846 [Homalodisca vitripennis]|nr:hypothetical protein J6590_051846 [Homalodisca vitripennis]
MEKSASCRGCRSALTLPPPTAVPSPGLTSSVPQFVLLFLRSALDVTILASIITKQIV